MDAWWKTPIEKGVIQTGKKVYRPPLPPTYKETELSEDLDDVMEWVLRDFRISLNEEKYPLPPRYYVMENYVQTNTMELDKSLKLQCCPSDL